MREKSSFNRPIKCMILLITALLLSYIFIPGIFGDKRITDEQRTSLSEQIAEQNETYYDGYFADDKWFADIYTYGAEIREGRLIIYADIATSEYIKLNEKAYDVSGSAGPCVIYAKSADGNIILDEIVYPDDGGMYIESLRKLFPLRYYLRMYLKNGGFGMDHSEHKLHDKVYKEWGVEASDDMLEIDEENKTYIITRVTNDDPFETEVVEEGAL